MRFWSLRWRSAGASRYRPAFVIAVVMIAWMPLRAMAVTGDPVYFAGVAFTGRAADTRQAFPHLSHVLNGDGYALVNRQIRQRLQGKDLALNVVFDQLGSIKDAARSTALALAIDRESTSVEHIGGVYKLRLEIAAQALFFDFKEKQVLGGFPLTLDFIDVRDEPPSEQEIQAAFAAMIVDGANAHSLVGEFAQLLGQVQVPSAATRHLRVSAVTLQPKALEYLAQAAPDVPVKTLQAQIAQEFGKYLAANQRLSLLPYQSDQALGASMAARFVEGGAFDLKIPDADYEVTIDVAGFKKVEQSHANASTLFLYGAFADIAVREPVSGKVYFSQRIKQGATKEVPVTQSSVDDWAASYETLLLLFNNFTQALSAPDNAWTRSALPEGREAKDQLSHVAELVKSCR